jgi:hypothetical protein
MLGSGVASPISTGGAGTDFERRVGAYYLAGTLVGSIPRGMKSGITREVRFQRLYQNEPLDDLIIISSLPSAEAKLALQLKRHLTFGDKDEIFDAVMKACWQTFASTEFDNSIDRFGVGLALFEKYRCVLPERIGVGPLQRNRRRLPRTRFDASSLKRIPTFFPCAG